MLLCVLFQGRKLEKQVEKLRRRSAQQADDIERLRSENSEMELLRVHMQTGPAHSRPYCIQLCALFPPQRRCGEQEECAARLTARVEELSEARSEQARQLAEARLRLQNEASRERKGSGSHERELRLLQQQLSQSRETEQQVSSLSPSHSNSFIYAHHAPFTAQYISPGSSETTCRS